MQGPAEANDSPSRARVLAAAEERFAAFGYRRTGIAEIARDAGVAPGTLYRYFENKEEIFRAVMREGPLRDVHAERAAFILFTGGDTLSSQTHYPYQEILPLYSEILMHGLLAR